MSKLVQRFPAPTLAMIHTWMNRGDPGQSVYYADVPNAIPVGMTGEQAQLVWSCSAEVFTENKLAEILAVSLQRAAVLTPIYSERVSTIESVSTREDAFDSSVFRVLRELAANVPGVEIDDRGSCM